MVALPSPEPVEAGPLVPRPLSVRRVRRETADTWTLTLDTGTGLFQAAPGQFNMLYAFGVGEVPVSVSGDTSKRGEAVHTLRAVGPVTAAICATKRGQALGVRGPFGRPWPLAEAAGRDIVLVAGGIGLAPLRPVMYQLLSQRERYGRLVLLCGARTPHDLLYRAELNRWRSRFDISVEVSVDSATGDWRGNVGVVTNLIARAQFDPDDAVAFVCGPEVMMRFTVARLREAGVPDDRIYISMERNMKCAVGFCGRCQFGPTFICKDGPVFRFDRIAPFLALREV
jgi:NAD(P)H-flavin reductase